MMVENTNPPVENKIRKLGFLVCTLHFETFFSNFMDYIFSFILLKMDSDSARKTRTFLLGSKLSIFSAFLIGKHSTISSLKSQ